VINAHRVHPAHHAEFSKWLCLHHSGRC